MTKLFKILLKRAGSVLLMVVAVAVAVGIMPSLGAVLSLTIFCVAFFALFVPLPRLGLGNRVFSGILVFLFGALGLGLSLPPVETAGDTAIAATGAPPSEAPAKPAAPEVAAVETPAPEAGDAAARQAEAEAARKEAEELARQKDYVLTLIGKAQFAEARAQVESLSAGNRLAPVADEFESAALAVVKPLPAAALEMNRDGYLLLAAIRPDDAAYGGKAKDYADRIVARKNQAVTMLRKHEDKVEGVTFYEHPNQPRFLNSRSTAFLYIGRKGDGRPWLRMRVQYTSSDWLFVDNVYAWQNGIKDLLISGPFDRDNNTTIWEWRDVTPSDRQVEILRALAEAPEAILRFEGHQYRRDTTLSASDKKAILDVLAAYEVMLAE